MSRRLDTLATVKKLAVVAERREAVQLAELMRRCDDKSGKLTSLQRYFEEYTAALADKARRGMTIADMRSQRAFITQLDEAVGQQQAAVAGAQRQLDEQRARWLAAKRKVQAIDELIARQTAAETKRLAKLEQNALDDLAGQQWTRRR